MTESALSIQGVSKSFGSHQALNNIHLDIQKGSIHGIIGPNGAGKTTLFSIISGFIKPDSGSVLVSGTDIKKVELLSGKISCLPQDAQFQSNIPIVEQLIFYLLLKGLSFEDAKNGAEESLHQVALSDKMHSEADVLSHGMLKRLGLAQAFLGEPELILLDEPTSGLDAKNAKIIRGLIKNNRGRATILVSSHNLAEIQDLCDYVTILNKGDIVSDDSMQEIVQGNCAIQCRLNRALNESELQRLQQFDWLHHVELLSHLTYKISFHQEGDSADSSPMISLFLKEMLSIGVIPQHLSEDVSLEDYFLDKTSDPPPS